MNPTRKQAIEELRRIVLDALGEHDAAVWLFGSCARGEPRQRSDIDIAILPRADLPLGFFAELEADIEDSTIPLRCRSRGFAPRRSRARRRNPPRRCKVAGLTSRRYDAVVVSENG
jgi:uncharacterized protein